MSKIAEMVILTRLRELTQKLNILPEEPFGLRDLPRQEVAIGYKSVDTTRRRTQEALDRMWDW